MAAAMASLLPPEIEAAAHKLVDLLRAETARYLPVQQQPVIRLEDARFSQVTDPANGLPGYEGVWRNSLNERVGRLIFNSDGSYYAEYDVVCKHPGDARWFVEAVTLWGRDGKVRGEPRLIPML